MRRDDRLTPGDHIIFATATTGGPVVYNVNAMRGSLAQRSKEMVAADLQRCEQQKHARKAAIKIYGEDGMDRSSMQVTAWTLELEVYQSTNFTRNFFFGLVVTINSVSFNTQEKASASALTDAKYM